MLSPEAPGFGDGSGFWRIPLGARRAGEETVVTACEGAGCASVELEVEGGGGMLGWAGGAPRPIVELRARPGIRSSVGLDEADKSDEEGSGAGAGASGASVVRAIALGSASAVASTALGASGVFSRLGGVPVSLEGEGDGSIPAAGDAQGDLPSTGDNSVSFRRSDHRQRS